MSVTGGFVSQGFDEPPRRRRREAACPLWCESPEYEGSNDEREERACAVRVELSFQSTLESYELRVEDALHLREGCRFAERFGENPYPTPSRHCVGSLVQSEKSVDVRVEEITLLVLLGACTGLRDEPLEENVEELRFVAKMMVYEPWSNPGACGNGGDRRSGITVLREHVCEGGEDLGSSKFSVARASHGFFSEMLRVDAVRIDWSKNQSIERMVVGMEHFVVAVVYALFVAGTLFACGAPMLPFLFATKRIRLVARNDQVELRGLDPVAMIWGCTGIALVTTFLFVQCSWWVGVPVAVASCVLCFGFRLSVCVRAGRTRMVRRFAYVVPWRVRCCDAFPEAFVDGWGDFSDPMSIYVECGDDRFELAWHYRDSGVDLDALARDFNEVVHKHIVSK